MTIARSLYDSKKYFAFYNDGREVELNLIDETETEIILDSKINYKCQVINTEIGYINHLHKELKNIDNEIEDEIFFKKNTIKKQKTKKIYHKNKIKRLRYQKNKLKDELKLTLIKYSKKL